MNGGRITFCTPKLLRLFMWTCLIFVFKYCSQWLSLCFSKAYLGQFFKISCCDMTSKPFLKLNVVVRNSMEHLNNSLLVNMQYMKRTKSFHKALFTIHSIYIKETPLFKVGRKSRNCPFLFLMGKKLMYVIWFGKSK